MSWWRRAVLTAASLLTALCVVGCGDGANAPTSDDLPLPPGVGVVADTGGGCGAGGEAHCGRGWILVPVGDLHREQVRDEVVALLRDDGWSVGPIAPDGSVAAAGPRRREVSVELVREQQLYVYQGSATPAPKRPLANDDRTRALRSGVEVSIDDCCGGWHGW